MKSIGMQAGRGDLKGAGKTALNYGKGTLGTAKNLAQMGIESGLLKSYYEAQRDAKNAREFKVQMDTQKKAGNLKHNTSPNEKENAQNAYIRQEIQNSLSPKDNYKYQLENAERAIIKGELPKPINTNMSHSYYSYNNHNNHDNDIDNNSNNYNNDNED